MSLLFMGLFHPISRLLIKTRRKLDVSRFVRTTQAGGPTSISRLLLYTWFPPARPVLPVEIAISAFGRTARFRPQSYFDLEVWRDVFEDHDYAIDLPEDPEVILDLGAHVGLSAIYFALKYPRAVVHCFEAEPRNYAALAENVAKLERVFPHHYAVCGNSRKVRLNVHPQSVSHSIVDRSEGGYTVEVQGHDLDTLAEIAGVNRIDLLKFNIEGMEF